jgi:N-acetylglucosamine-6-sulfatase
MSHSLFAPGPWRFVLALTAACAAGDVLYGAEQASSRRPNIVFILMDDLRWDELGCVGHPFVKTPNIDRLAREGALFRNAFATTPLCSPSRASILTGLYPHSHGVRDNTNNDALSHRLTTFLLLLQRAGYCTSFIGKWHMGTDDSPRPGIDHWVSFKGQGEYINPRLNVNGHAEQATGYATDILNERAIEFLRRPHERPFALYLSHKAVHPELEQRPDGTISDPSASTFLPAQRHKNLYADAKVPRRPNALIDRLEGKPALLRSFDRLPPLSRATGTSDAVIRDRLRMLMAAEEGVGQILETLQATKQLDHTLIVFTSDHGYFYGEHGLSVERRLAYEEAARIPLLMRYPPLIRPGSVFDPFVLTIDLAPSFLQLAGVNPSTGCHGRSMVPFLKNEQTKLRDEFIIEYFSDKVFPRMERMGYQAVRTGRWKYIHYTDLRDMDELYDLQADPYEMRNRVDEPGSAEALAELKTTLQRLLSQTP